jgi:Lactoylglutathione lyase and related lyases
MILKTQWIFMGLLVLVGCIEPEKDTTLVETGTHYKRINLVVADLDRSLTIYRDILGFSPNAISESDSTSYSYPVFKFADTTRLRFCTLNSPDQVRAMALTEASGIDLPVPSASPHMSASVIRVQSVDEAIEKVVKLGLQTTEVKVVESQERAGYKEQAFVDFDGHLIVLFEYLK